MVEALRQAKGYVFEGGRTSYPGNPPRSPKLKAKNVMDMTPAEYASAAERPRQTAAAAAAHASGARDLHCPEKLTEREIARHRSPADFLVDGCGQRATYASDYTSLLLTSIVRLGQ